MASCVLRNARTFGRPAAMVVFEFRVEFSAECKDACYMISCMSFASEFIAPTLVRASRRGRGDVFRTVVWVGLRSWFEGLQPQCLHGIGSADSLIDQRMFGGIMHPVNPWSVSLFETLAWAFSSLDRDGLTPAAMPLSGSTSRRNLGGMQVA